MPCVGDKVVVGGDQDRDVFDRAGDVVLHLLQLERLLPLLGLMQCLGTVRIRLFLGKIDVADLRFGQRRLALGDLREKPDAPAGVALGP